jgi:hypothetical protein
MSNPSQTRIALVRADVLQLTADHLHKWLYDGGADVDRLNAKVDAVIARFDEESRRIAGDAAIRAIDRLRTMRDMLELAGRPEGKVIQISRDEYDAIMNDIGVVSCAVRAMAEG